MRHRKFTFIIGRTSARRRADMANMTCSFLEYGQVKTTLARAKQLRRIADRMITLGKRGTLHARRQAVAKLRQKPVVKMLFDEIAPQYSDRPGGYTRIIKLGKRPGDAAEMCFVELVKEPYEPKQKKTAETGETVAAVEASEPSAEATQADTDTNGPAAGKASGADEQPESSAEESEKPDTEE